MADELLSIALDSTGGDLDRALRQLAAGAAPGVLGAIRRDLTLLTAAQRLRDLEPADGRNANGDSPLAVSDIALPTDPWESGDPTATVLETGRALFEAVPGAADSQRTSRARSSVLIHF